MRKSFQQIPVFSTGVWILARRNQPWQSRAGCRTISLMCQTQTNPGAWRLFSRLLTRRLLKSMPAVVVPLLVGGTGQYIRAVLEGWEIPNQVPDIGLRDALERWAAEIGPYGLHDRLAILDPASAENIDARNVRRTIRALEVTLRSGQRFSEQRQRSYSPYSLLIIGLKRPRVELYQRVDERIEVMLATGFIAEVQAMLDKGYMPNLPTLSAIGYREIVAYLQGEITLEEAKAQMKRQTRRFVRHQGAWFNEKDPKIHWLDVSEGTVTQIEALI